MKISAIRIVVILGTLSIIGIVVIQVYWLMNAFDNEQRQFDRSIRIALRTVAEQLARYNGSATPRQNLVSRPGSNYYVVNVNSQIDASLLDYYLRTELGTHNLNTDFEYGIYDCTSDQMVYGNYITMGPTTAVPTTPRPLPKYNAYTYYFGVLFPHKTNYLIGKLEIWMLTTVILLLVIVFFAYALFVILKQKRLSEIQKDFINNMTHEFKTPITTISISAAVLSEPGIVENRTRLFTYSGIIAQESNRLYAQVEKVLQMASLDSRETKLKLVKTNINNLITQVASTFQSGKEIEKSVITLQLNAIQDSIMADELHLTNVLFNLLDNAVKYSGTHAIINIRTRNEQNYLLLEITDQGPGIPKKYQKLVFEKFFRVPTGNLHNIKGFGLGLNYVRNIVKAHKWHLNLNSDAGKGCVFTIRMRVG